MMEIKHDKPEPARTTPRLAILLCLILIPIVLLCVFCTFFWLRSLRTMRLVATFPNINNLNCAFVNFAGEGGVPYAEGKWPDRALNSTTLGMIGWDGKITWRVPLPKVVLSSKTHGWRRVLLSPNMHYLAQAIYDGKAVTVTTWRDGQLIARFTLPTVSNPAKTPAMCIQDSGRILLLFAMHPQLTLFAIEKDRLVASGSVTSRIKDVPKDTYVTDIAPDGSTVTGFLPSSKGASYPYDNFEYLHLVVAGKTIRFAPFYTGKAKYSLVLHQGGIVTDAMGNAFADRGKLTISLADNEGEAEAPWQLIPDTSISAKSLQPQYIMLNPVTNEHWTVISGQQIHWASVSTDGRFAAVMQAHDPPVWQQQIATRFPIFEHYVYSEHVNTLIIERPGRIRARLPNLTEKVMSCYYLSPNGHYYILVGNKETRVYTW